MTKVWNKSIVLASTHLFSGADPLVCEAPPTCSDAASADYGSRGEVENYAATVGDNDRVSDVLASPLGRQFLLGLIGKRAGEQLDWSSERVARRAIRAAVEERGALPDDALELLGALAHETFQFGFDSDDEWRWPLVRAAADELRPVGSELVAITTPRGWWDPVDRADQRLVHWDDLPEIGPGGIEAVVRDSVERTRVHNDQALERTKASPRPGGRVGAFWWSAPDFSPLTWTTRAVAPLPSTALLGFIDTHQPLEATGASVYSFRISPNAHVYEIVGPEDWRHLVERFPIDVTGTHDGEWREWGGVTGPWVLPDWTEVMEHYDGVHVTIGGYLASWGLALPVGAAHTMLAGWIPDATLWLHTASVDRRFLGRWHGTPTANVDNVMTAWEPA